MPNALAPAFHGQLDTLAGEAAGRLNLGSGFRLGLVDAVTTRTLDYRFDTHFHPYVDALVRRLVTGSVAGLQAADTEVEPGAPPLPDGSPRPRLYAEIFTATDYAPAAVRPPFPVKELDFASGGAYAVYNWELFFHVPLAVAINLSRNQRYEEAQRWFHHVFDPTDSSEGPTPERFWKVRPFQRTAPKQIEDILVNLSTGADPKLRDETLASIAAWKDAPFRPHVVARYRPWAYMYKAVMAYLDNLVAWGDSLFRQDTGEAIDEALQLYVLAANILGPRPQAVPRQGSVRPQTYATLRADLNGFADALRGLEADLAFDTAPHPTEAAAGEGVVGAEGLATALYFCVPRNDQLLGYWDTVADRLFKIRNSLNLQGVFRQLALFEPPIPPGLLARAVAAGVDVAAVAAGGGQPLPLVRFQALVQKAAEICQEVKSLGGHLLAALEKEDNEALAVLRARHETVILGLAESVKYAQWQEALKSREGLEKSLASAVQRYTYYERLLGRAEGDIKIPQLPGLDPDELARMRLRVAEPEVAPRPIDVRLVGGLLGAGHPLNPWEVAELALLEGAQTSQDAAAALEATGAFLSLIPDASGHATPVGVGAAIKWGGTNLGHLFRGLAAVARGVGGRLAHEASLSGRMAGYDRREQEWALQSNLAAGEINQIFKQLRAADIRVAMAEREWKNHQQQIRHAEEVERFLTDERTGKKSSQAFYAWMKREVKGLYAQCFQLAFDVARKAERALQYELGNPRLSFLQFGYLAGREGLLAGERLYLDVKRMEMAYHDLNQREYELTRSVSLLQVSPRALLELRATGRCTVALPEELFDLDGPGHYFRRIRSAAVSIPAVAGPYTSVSCTLRLLKSSIRISPLLKDGAYARDGAEDDRFSDHFGSLQAVVTSTGQNDAGVFDPGQRDERYLPFEGSGVVSEWSLELPDTVRQFDYDTISDVVLHLRYTAREGGTLLRNGAVANLEDSIKAAQALGSVRLFSVRHEFPDEWARFRSATVNTGATPKVLAPLALTLRPEHYPFWSRGRLQAVKRADLFARRAAAAAVDVFGDATGTGAKDTLTRDPSLRLHTAELHNVPPAGPLGQFTLHFADNTVEDLWLAVTWGAA